MKIAWTWKESFQFAFATAFLSQDHSLFIYSKSLTEQFGAFFITPLYKSIGYVSKHIQKPIAIVLFTIAAALFAILVFYNISTITILGKLFPPKLVRCLLFMYVELNIFAMGCCAFGRFSNKSLIEFWKQGKLIPIFLGDQKHR